MSQYLLFLVLGLGVGAIYAGLTIGIVLTYQGSGVINFAAAAMATLPLYVFSDLRAGRLTLPLPWVPSIDMSPPTWAAVLIALVVAAGLGALVDVAVSRPLRNAPVLAKVIAAVGVMVTMSAAIALKYGTELRLPNSVLPSGTVSIAGFPVPIDRLWLTGVVIVLSAALAVWFARSRAGVAIQAAAENERAAAFARLSPPALGTLTWMLATAFVSLVMIIAGPAIGVLTPGNLTLLVVPALAVALIARLESLWWALGGALALGVLQSYLLFLSSTKDWWPEWAKEGLNDAVPFVVIVITLFVSGRSIPERGEDIRSRMPPVILPRNRPLVVAGLVVAGVAALAITSGSYRFGVITSLAVALIGLSLVLLTGMVGQISLAQTAFAGVAGLVLSKFGADIPFPWSLLLAATVAAAGGVIVGLPALRIRGAQLAIVTLAAAVAIERFVLGNPHIVSGGTNLIPPPDLFGLDLSVRAGRNVARLPFGILVLVVVALAFVLVSNIMRAGSGRKMLAVRSNERAAASIGIAVPTIKLSAFALSSFLAGLGGALIGYSRGQLSPESFGVFVGLSFLAITYLSGITSVSGALVAGALATLGIVYVIVDRSLGVAAYYALVSGPLLILTVIFNPVGISGRARVVWDALRGRRGGGGDAGDAMAVAELAAADAGRVAATTPPPRRAIGDVLLRADEISVSYGGLRAVDRLSLDVRAGEIVGLIGPNGAGKTSFIDAITGFTPCTGQVHLGGELLEGAAASARARKGLVRTWQSVELFDDLSVEDNVRVSDDVRHDGWKMLRDAVRPNAPASPAVGDAIALVGLAHATGRKPAELPLGHQKLVGVARSLALRPQVLLLDEPAAGLDVAEIAAFGRHLREIAATGVGCLLVDHDMRLVLGVCDRVYVIDFGSLIASGPTDQVRGDPAVIAAYLGSEHRRGAVSTA
jgi:ABC-type branched-subunit amino acid transport system ATPase component/branched-subunit amino acid ABC-type transport system permease component